MMRFELAQDPLLVLQLGVGSVEPRGELLGPVLELLVELLCLFLGLLCKRALAKTLCVYQMLPSVQMAVYRSNATCRYYGI